MKLSFFTLFFWGGLAYEHLWQENFAAGSIFRSPALCLLDLLLMSKNIKQCKLVYLSGCSRLDLPEINFNTIT